MTSIRRFFFLALLLGGLVPAFGQPPSPRTTGSISGRITIEGQPASGVEVMLRSASGNPNMDFGMAAAPPRLATTDAEGRYRLANLAAGGYRVTAYAPAFIGSGDHPNFYEAGKGVNLAENETVEGVNFEMTRGGVITGRVTDDEGRPVIAESVLAFRLDEKGKRVQTNPFELKNAQTDDRGIYRLFGLEAGRYLVGAGSSPEDGGLRMGAAGYFKRTYHPDATDEARGKVLEVKPGGEVEDADIRLARPAKGYAASGRVIDGETGKPAAGLMILYAVTKKNSFSVGVGGASTNSQGEFRLEGLAPNSYSASTMVAAATDQYVDPVEFEIVSSDVSGLEIKLGKGATISGVAVFEGVRDPKILASLTKMQVNVFDESAPMMAMMGGQRPSLQADGTFRVGGIRPGKVRVLPSLHDAPPGISLARTEWNGAEVKDFTVGAGEQITGVRLVLTYGTGSIAGRVEMRGGSLPAGARLTVSALREGESADDFWRGKTAQPDARGQFLIEGLLAGTYRLVVKAFDANSQELRQAEQSVTVSGSGREEATLVLDWAAKGGGQ